MDVAIRPISVTGYVTTIYIYIYTIMIITKSQEYT